MTYFIFSMIYASSFVVLLHHIKIFLCEFQGYSFYEGLSLAMKVIYKAFVGQHQTIVNAKKHNL